MSKHNRDGFIVFVEGLKSAFRTLTDDQLGRLRQKAQQNYGLTAQETEQILEDLGLTVINYFEVLGLTIEELENHSEDTVKKRVQDAWYPPYDKALKDHTSRGVSRRNLLNRAKNTLIDPRKRRDHIEVLTQVPELTEIASHSIGIKFVTVKGKEFFHEVIPKMTPIPSEVVIEHFGTAEPNQEDVLFEIYEGLEQNQLFEEVTDPEAFKLGDCHIKLPPKLPKGSIIRVTFKKDADQTLEVTAEGPDGRHANVTIEREVHTLI